MPGLRVPPLCLSPLPPSCTPLVFRSDRSKPRHPPAPLRGSLARLQAGKVPRPDPAGGRAGGRCCRLCGKAREAAARPPAPRRPPPRVGTPDFPAAGAFGGPRAAQGTFAASAASRAPPAWRAILGICPGAACTPGAFPEDVARSAGAPCVAACVPGALARSGKKRAVFAFANKRELELFLSGEAGRAAPCLPSRHLAALGSRTARPGAPGR